ELDVLAQLERIRLSIGSDDRHRCRNVGLELRGEPLVVEESVVDLALDRPRVRVIADGRIERLEVVLETDGQRAARYRLSPRRGRRIAARRKQDRASPPARHYN